MKERVEGALEAIAWTERLLERGAALGWDIKKIKEKVEEAKERLISDVADSFLAS